MTKRARDREELPHDTRKTVFLVDRSDSFIMYLRILLERMGFRVVPLKKGRLLRELLPIVQPALVLLGAVSEGTDPVEVLRGLAGDDGKPAVPVVLITQRDEEELGFDPKEAGFAGALGRPVNIFRLFKVIYDQIVFASGEKRVHLRTPFHEKVTVHRGGRAAAFRATSLSEGGLFVRTGEAMKPGEALRIELPLGFGAPETLPGEVIYRKTSREDEPPAESGVAIRFTAVTQDQAARLTVSILGLLVGDILEDQEEPVLSLVSQTNTLYEEIVREHIRLGQELKSAELHLKTVVDALPTGMLTYRVDAEGGLELLSTNPAAERIFGGEGGRAGDRGQAGPDWDGIGIAGELRRVARDGGTFQESGLPWRDGATERFLDLLVFQARPGTAAVLVGDVTRRARAEAEQIRLQKLESLGFLAGGIAHDFNNLLQGISGSVEVARGLLGDGGRDCPAQRVARILYLLGQAETGAARASKLSRQLLTFAKGGDPVVRPIDLGPVVAEALEMALPGAGLRSRVEVPKGLHAVRGDADLLHQVFTNLAVNARQAMPQGGEVAVTAQNVEVGADHPSLVPGPYVLVTFRDSGVGIPEKILPNVFDPYFTTKQEGSGLGLSTALAIVHKHGGWIDLQSEPDRGTTVAVHLPAVPAGSPGETREAGREPWKGSGKVLVMDDEQLLWPGLQGMLESLGFSSVFTAEGGEMLKAYAKARRSRKPFDAVILDLTVRSGMGGQEAARRLMELDPGVCALVSSGYANAPILANHAQFGFRAALPKPYTLGALARALEEALG